MQNVVGADGCLYKSVSLAPEHHVPAIAALREAETQGSQAAAQPGHLDLVRACLKIKRQGMWLLVQSPGPPPKKEVRTLTCTLPTRTRSKATIPVFFSFIKAGLASEGSNKHLVGHSPKALSADKHPASPHCPTHEDEEPGAKRYESQVVATKVMFFRRQPLVIFSALLATVFVAPAS